MPRYTVQHKYRAVRDGQVLGPWRAGDEVELAEADAAWLEQDSPGLLATPAPTSDPTPVVDVERQQTPARDRQARGVRNRGA